LAVCVAQTLRRELKAGTLGGMRAAELMAQPVVLKL
jgi:hypothetical protein